MKLLTKQPIWTIALLTSSIFIYSCGDDDTPPAPKDTTPPIVTIDNIQVFANESDNNPNDASFYVAATDNKDANPTTTVTVDNKKVTVGNDGKYFVANLQSGTHTIKAKSTDKAGNQGTTEATFTIEADTQAPTVAIENFEIINADNDATDHKNDLKFTVKASDDRKVESIVATIDGEKITADGNTYRAYNLAPGSHTLVVTAIDEAGNKSVAEQGFDIEPPMPKFGYNLKVNPDNIKDGMPAGTEIAKIDLLADEVPTSIAQLKAQGYTVIVTVDNTDQLKVVGDETIVLAKDLDRDGEDGNDPEELKYLKGKVTVMVLKNDKDGNAVVVFEDETDLDVEVEDTDDYTPTFEGKKLKIDGKPIVVEKNGKLAVDYVTGKKLFNAENEEAMNNKDIENVIDGGQALFNKYVFDTGTVFPEFKKGEHKGKLVSSGALESLSYAVGEVKGENYPKLGSEYFESMQKIMGQILADLPDDAWEVGYVNEELGVTFMKLKDEVAAKVAGASAYETLKKYDPKDYQ